MIFGIPQHLTRAYFCAMTSYVDLWKLLAGLGLFLFTMLQMEEAIKALAVRKDGRQQ